MFKKGLRPMILNYKETIIFRQLTITFPQISALETADSIAGLADSGTDSITDPVKLYVCVWGLWGCCIINTINV